MSTVISLTEPEFWARLAGIVIIDLTLAGDNALVIALAVRSLPPRERFWGRIWGTAGAVALRVALIGVMSRVLGIPLLQLAGGLLLIWIAVRLVRQEPSPDRPVQQGTSLREAIWIIVVADAAMSLDNVLGVTAAAGGDLVLVVGGIGLSLPLVVWGSGVLSRLMNRFPMIIWIGGGILGYVAGDMALHDPAVQLRLGTLGGVLGLVPIALAAVIGALGWHFARKAPAPVPSPADRRRHSPSESTR